MEAYRLENKKLTSLIKHYQSKLLPYAYNIIGDFMEAEDIVQEVLNKHFLSPNEHIEKLDNYLIKSVINRSINQKQLLRNRKEKYPGEWLPTPVFTEDGIYLNADKKQMLNYALLVLLEHLNPKERAVYILKETFDFPHNEVAEILDINIEHSRQLLKRAKQKLEPKRDLSSSINNKSSVVLQQLTDAILYADIEKVKDLLTADVQCHSDGGAKVSAARNILRGQDKVIKLLKAIYTKYLLPNSTIKFTTVNHSPAMLYSIDGALYRCIVFKLRGTIIEKIYIVVNPDKLKSLKKFL